MPTGREAVGGLACGGALKYELNFMSELSSATKIEANGHTARRLETRRKLLEAGAELFAEHGVPAVTSTAIARHAGVATGTFYLHFPDKHALFEELLDAALEEMRPKSDPERAGSRGEASMRRDLERMLEVAQRRRSLIRAVFDRGESAGLAERIQDRLAHELEQRYTRVFHERGIGLHPGAAAQARAAVLVRVIAWWAEEPERAERDEIVDVLMALAPGRVREKSQ